MLLEEGTCECLYLGSFVDNSTRHNERMFVVEE